MVKKSITLVSLVVLLAFVLGACAPAAEPAAAEPAAEEAAAAEPAAEEAAAGPSGDPIRIGMGAIMTGSDTYIHGELITDAALLAAEEINAAGGVLGRPLEIVIQDDAGDPKQAVNVAQSFCDDDSIVAVMVDPYSGMAFAAMPVYDACGMPMINHGSNPRITEQGFAHAIQTNPNDLITGSAAADYAFEKAGVKTVAIIHNKSMFGKGVSDVFKLRAEELGISVTSYQGVDPEDVDFTPVLTKIKQENPDAIYFGGYTEGALIKNQMTQLGMTQKFIAAEMTSSEYVDVVKENGAGTITATGAPPLDFRPEIAEFDAKFFAKYGKHPESWAPYYYDRVYAYADIITKAGEATREAIGEHLHDVDIKSIIYPEGLQVDESGRAKNPVTFIFELQPDLTFKLVYTWQGTPPYESMSKEDYDALIKSLS
jgi:branched-chain amino acid transport system substrate-binding protein